MVSGRAPRAYPRAGGGTRKPLPLQEARLGLSPRRRGNHFHVIADDRRTGPIPAQAGEPRVRGAGDYNERAYPRAGGGTFTSRNWQTYQTGLSPRRRGNPREPRTLPRRHGPIPAQAGEPIRSTMKACSIGAYPRAGGGTCSTPRAGRIRPGLSPRRRGNPEPLLYGRTRFGPIPAQAGEPIRCPVRRCSNRAYPRAGGGTILIELVSKHVRGLSPRRRGNQRLVHWAVLRNGPIPAQAGEPRPGHRHGAPSWAYPRAGGGTFDSPVRVAATRAYPRAGGGTAQPA